MFGVAGQLRILGDHKPTALTRSSGMDSLISVVRLNAMLPAVGSR